MPTAFETSFDRGAKRLLARQGKQVFYIPRDGQPRPLLALVDTFPPMPVPETGQVIAAHTEIECRNTAETYDTDGYGGIAAEFLDTGGDKIRLQVNGEWTELSIRKRLPNQDEAMLKLELG